MGDGIMTRPALGQIAGLGVLYDAYNDNFCGLSIFRREPPQESLEKTDCHGSDIKFVHSDDYKEKFSALKVNAELQASFLGGLVKVSGSGDFLKDDRSSQRIVKSSLVYNITTVHEKINIFSDSLKNSLALEAIQYVPATHVVTEITWGANSIVTAEHKISSNDDILKVQGQFKAALEFVSLQIKGEVGMKYEGNHSLEGNSFQIKVNGDILSDGDPVPTNFKEALQFIQKVPSMVKAANSGKGKPLFYTLVPIDLIKKTLKLEILAATVLERINEDIIIRFVGVFDEFRSTSQKLNDYYEDIRSHTHCIPPEEITRVSKLKEDFAILESKTRVNFASLLQGVRRGYAQPSQIQELHVMIRESPVSPNRVMTGTEDYQWKMQFADFLRSMSIVYIGYGMKADLEILKNDGDVYLFYFNAISDRHESWTENRQLLLNLVKESSSQAKRKKILAFDCDAQGLSLESPRIAVFDEAQETIHDLLRERRKCAAMCLATYTGNMVRLARKPNKRVTLELPCPQIQCKLTDKKEWTCETCSDIIEYGFDGFFYCSCGKGHQAQYKFKCGNPSHGVSFYAFEEKILEVCYTSGERIRFAFLIQFTFLETPK